MPDYFVPIDTAYYSDYYRNLISKGIFNRFILNYVDDNRNQLKNKYPAFKKFNESFVPSENMINELIKFAESEGVDYNDEEFQRSRSMIELLLKAYIARDFWESSEFYQILNLSDPIFNRAVEIVESTTLYDKKLQAYSGD